MTKYYVHGSVYKPLRNEDVPLCDSLPPAVYVMQNLPMEGFVLEKRDSFNLPSKLYGQTNAHAERIMQTFEERPHSTGVLLVGEKGSGKTLLAKKLSHDAMEKGWPTVLINQPFGGDEFMSAVQAIDTPCVILFDEFDKVFIKHSKKNRWNRDEEENDDTNHNGTQSSQDGILTLLDGVFPSKKLFILTSNERHSFSTYLKNRPGRLFYHIDYKGVDAGFIREYCQDRLLNKENMQGVINLSYMFEHFNFDMMQAVVEEMNRYSETAQQAVQLLNIKVFEDFLSPSYKVSLKIKEIPATLYSGEEHYHDNPLTQKRIRFNYTPGKPRKNANVNWERVEFAPNDLVAITKEGQLTFQNSDGAEATFEKIEHKAFSYTNYIDRFY